MLARRLAAGSADEAIFAVVEDLSSQFSSDPAFGRVTDLLVSRGDRVLAHRRVRELGTESKDLFSVTKTVLAMVFGIAWARGQVDLDTPVRSAPRLRPFDELQGLAAGHLLALTRGTVTGGAYDLDEVALADGSWAERFASAPVERPPGAAFRYDNGASQLLAELLDHLLDDLAGYAEAELFAPLGITDWSWACDPAGVPSGAAHLRMGAESVAALGRLLCQSEATRGLTGLDQAWVERMRSPVTDGGPPEGRPYGLGVWVESPSVFFGAGWGGQLLLCRPEDQLVIVTLSDPGFSYGPPARDEMPVPWRAPLDLIRLEL